MSWVPEHIEIQGRQANDIKHSASWEATQVFLNLPFFLVQVLLFIFCDFRFLVLSVIGVFVCLSTFRMRGYK